QQNSRGTSASAIFYDVVPLRPQRQAKTVERRQRLVFDRTPSPWLVVRSNISDGLCALPDAGHDQRSLHGCDEVLSFRTRLGVRSALWPKNRSDDADPMVECGDTRLRQTWCIGCG